jgi:hypothetical protein
MTIQILGTGCPKCRQLESNARDALAGMTLDATVVVKSTGKVLSKGEIAQILEGGMHNG